MQFSSSKTTHRELADVEEVIDRVASRSEKHGGELAGGADEQHGDDELAEAMADDRIASHSEKHGGELAGGGDEQRGDDELAEAMADDLKLLADVKVLSEHCLHPSPLLMVLNAHFYPSTIARYDIKLIIKHSCWV